MAGKVVEILIVNDSLNTLAAVTKIIQKAHFQDMSELCIVKVTLTFPYELYKWCQPKRQYFSELNESFSIPKQLLSNSISLSFNALTREISS